MDQPLLIKLVVGIGGAILAHCLTVWLTGSAQRWFGCAPAQWLYEPIPTDELPPKHARFFDKRGAEFVELGFAPIGDFVVRRQPKLSTARCLLSADGTKLAVIENYCGQETFACVSMLADGTYLETGATDSAPPVQPGIPMVLISADPQTVPGVIQQHRLALADLCLAKETDALPMADDDFREVLLYGQRLVMRLMHAQGVLPELPAFARDAKETVV